MKKRIVPFIFLALTFVLLTSVVYAWFSTGIDVKTELISVNVGTNQVETHLFVQKQGEEEVLITNQAQLAEILKMGIPSDEYVFRIKIVNHMSNTATASIIVNDITSTPDIGFSGDLKDAYLIKDLNVKVVREGLPIENLYLTPNSPTQGVGVDGQVLSVSRINNVIVDNKIVLANNILIASGEAINIKITLAFDSNIVSTEYRGQMIFNEFRIVIGE
ncbi:MAG: hypothetical protein GX931_06035 [Acholeplasmataceae bacterium]|nr:hypothetical protein [Acholeplasmataceae bacterium]